MTVSLLGAGDVRSLLAESGVRPSRHRGQNFLADPNLVRRIVRLADVGPGDTVLEIGVGVGSLTVGLVAAGARVVGIDVEPAFCEVVRGLVPPGRAVLLCADATELDWDAAMSGRNPTKLVANLPYSVGTTVLLDVLAEVPTVRSGVVMVQREVAARICAEPVSPAYGAVSVKIDSVASTRMLGQVPRNVFVPEPEVTSALVGFTRREDVDPGPEIQWLWKVVDAAFAHRRKTLRNSLLSAWPSDVVDAALDAAGLDGRHRGEQLTTGEFRRLAEALGSAPDRTPDDR